MIWRAFGGEVCELAHRVHREAALLPPTPIADLEKTLYIGPNPEAVSSGVFRQVSFAPPVVVSGLPTNETLSILCTASLVPNQEQAKL
jgi:hypothetical protein